MTAPMDQPHTYLVMQGEYSDKRTLCAAPDRATADAIAERVNRVEGTGWKDAYVKAVPVYGSDDIPCVVTRPYNDDYTEVTWPWSYDWDAVHAQKVASDAAAKAAAQEAGL